MHDGPAQGANDERHRRFSKPSSARPQHVPGGRPEARPRTRASAAAPARSTTTRWPPSSGSRAAPCRLGAHEPVRAADPGDSTATSGSSGGASRPSSPRRRSTTRRRAPTPSRRRARAPAPVQRGRRPRSPRTPPASTPTIQGAELAAAWPCRTRRARPPAHPRRPEGRRRDPRHSAEGRPRHAAEDAGDDHRGAAELSRAERAAAGDW